MHVYRGAIRDVLEKYPLSVRQRDPNNYGRIPLHVAMQCGCYHVTDLLLRKWPRSVHIKDRMGQIPLHACAESYCPGGDAARRIDAAHNLVKRSPRSVRQRDALGRLPLHAHLASNGPQCPEMVEFLVEEWPGALCVGNAMGQWPLHVACGKPAASFDVGRGSVPHRSVPRGSPTERRSGSAPASRRGRIGGGGSILRLLPQRRGGAVPPIRVPRSPPREKHSRKFAPSCLILAATSCFSLPRRVPRRSPSTTDADKLPLHRLASRYSPITTAFRHDKAFAVVDRIVDLDPQALQTRDARGQTPLHHALRCYDCRDLALHLLELRPATVQDVDWDEMLPPLLLAAAHNASLSVLYKLAIVWPKPMMLPNGRRAGGTR